jgi:CDP-diacylglycerol--glycerol-3-phosphate 3-phosphatidyltransferase
VVVVILCREFIVTGLRSLGERHGRTISADRWGKIKTITQIIAIIYCLVHLVAEAATINSPAWSEIWLGGLGKWSRVLLDVLVTTCLVATVASGVTYLRNNWDLVSERDM